MTALRKLLLGLSLLPSLSSGVLADTKSREATPAVVNPPIRWEQAQWQSLDGTWQFAKDPKLVGEKEGWFRPDKALVSKSTQKR